MVYAVIDVETALDDSLISIGVVVGEKGNPKPIDYFYGVVRERMDKGAMYKSSIGLSPEDSGLGSNIVTDQVVLADGRSVKLDLDKVAGLKEIVKGYEKATGVSLYKYTGRYDQLEIDHPVWGELFKTDSWKHRECHGKIKEYKQSSSSFIRLKALLGDTEFIMTKAELGGGLREILQKHQPQVLLAYNAKFDQGVIGKAVAEILPQVEWRCIMQVARNIHSNPRLSELKAFPGEDGNLNYFTNGNIKSGYSAEEMYKLLFNRGYGDNFLEEYVETHNAILDAMDEFEIFRALADDPYLYPETKNIQDKPWFGTAPFKALKR
jgi:DNA polymerase III epsilon subunit-like protein